MMLKSHKDLGTVEDKDYDKCIYEDKKTQISISKHLRKLRLESFERRTETVTTISTNQNDGPYSCPYCNGRVATEDFYVGHVVNRYGLDCVSWTF